ncbi:hypothetical protein GCM10011506_18980 [Marivirga lumbricoides]|uniref:Toxin-antitoxin system YwqK family antitoxin n=1 Tax=Marivirga lumbricoides TaxID=1046115 RepID=A0ABQ1M6Y1_9BACT|nr:hypothetical protein GCM10011506_18980 [Marivirga lumbricoides]
MNIGFLTRHILILCVLVLFESCTSVEKEYYPSGKIAYEYNIENGKKDGVALKYYESGELMQKSNWAEGEKVGKSFTYYKSGVEKYIANFENNKQDGWTFYYDSLGNLRGKQEFVDGNLDGKFEEYYADGTVMAKGTNSFKGGTKKIYEYFPNGKPKRFVYERNDSLIYLKSLDETGDITNAYFTIKLKAEDENQLCFIIDTTIIPEDELSVEVVFNETSINGNNLKFRAKGRKVCVAKDKFKDKETVSGLFCEVFTEDESYHGCNNFSFDLQ